MSKALLDFAIAFANGKPNTLVFSEKYQELWKIERDSKQLLKDNNNLSECLSTIFCLVDLYNPNPNKLEYELDSHELQQEIISVLKKHHFLKI